MVLISQHAHHDDRDPDDERPASDASQQVQAEMPLRNRTPARRRLLRPRRQSDEYREQQERAADLEECGDDAEGLGGKRFVVHKGHEQRHEEIGQAQERDAQRSQKAAEVLRAR